MSAPRGLAAHWGDARAEGNPLHGPGRFIPLVVVGRQCRWCPIHRHVILAIARHRPLAVIAAQGVWVVLFAMGIWLHRHPLTVVVTTEGIRMPMRRRPIHWDEVAAVQRPGPYSDVVVLQMNDGSEKRLPLPSSYAEQVATLGAVHIGRG